MAKSNLAVTPSQHNGIKLNLVMKASFTLDSSRIKHLTDTSSPLTQKDEYMKDFQTQDLKELDSVGSFSMVSFQ